MKRTVGLIGVFLLTAALAVPVMAQGPGWGKGRPGRGGWGQGPGSGWATGGGYASNLNQEQQSRVEDIHRRHYEETAQVRAELWAKKAELRALLASESPDAAKVRAVQKEINDLRSTLSDKRTDLNLELSKVAPGAGSSRGHGPGYGPHMRGGYGPHMGGGYGPGACWQ